MATAPQSQSPEGVFSPQEFLVALSAAGPAALSEALGDLAFLLQGLAQEPGELFETDGWPRSVFAHLLGNLQASRGALESLEARTVLALRDTTRRERHDAARDHAGHEHGGEPSENEILEAADGSTARDISLLTRRSPHKAGRTLASSQRLVDSLPQMMAALATGKVGGDAAYAVAEATAGFDPDLAREVDRTLGERLADFDGAGTRRWKNAVATIAGELDPEGATLRHRRARKERHVTLTPGQHGMATLSARLPAIDARIIHKRLSLEAERRRAAGARQGHGANMADAFTDTFLKGGAGDPAVTLDIGVIITDRALFRPDAGDTAQLEGYGPVPVEAVREQLRAVTAEPDDPQCDQFGAAGRAVRAEIRRLYTHPLVGELVAMDARSRTFPPALKRFLTWRDTSCRGPFCNAMARQADHIVPVSRGGPTNGDNGEDLCAHCNKKESDTANVERINDPELPGHRVRWTGHAGTTRDTAPNPLLWPRRLEPEAEPANQGDPRAGSTGASSPRTETEGRAGATLPPRSTRRARLSPPRPRRAGVPPAQHPPSRRPPGRSGPATSAAAGRGRRRRGRPSGPRKRQVAPTGDLDR